MIYERFYSVRSDGDICTMYSDRTLINRRNVVNDPKNAYAANRDFLILEVKARVIAAAMEVDLNQTLEHQPNPLFQKVSKTRPHQKNENIFIKLQAK